MSDELYKRQDELDTQLPNEVTVIGLGGTGSWTALNLAMAGVEKLYLIDPDIIEEHNLNRTPYRQQDIDKNKVDAMMELILARRPECEVVGISQYDDEVPRLMQDDIEGTTVIDCRDTTAELADYLEDPAMKLGYDGFEVTIHTNPDYGAVWSSGDHEGYDTVPSFVAPPQFMASIATALLSKQHDIDLGDDNVSTTDMIEEIMALMNRGE